MGSIILQRPTFLSEFDLHSDLVFEFQIRQQQSWIPKVEIDFNFVLEKFHLTGTHTPSITSGPFRTTFDMRVNTPENMVTHLTWLIELLCELSLTSPLLTRKQIKDSIKQIFYEFMIPNELIKEFL